MSTSYETLRPREHDLGGGFMVRRVLPAFPRQAVGPFLFLDHFGPHVTQPGDDHDVRPHPHIGLSTVTYLFEGSMVHRDSTGAVQAIEPGAINWMCAGRGIVHSERLPEASRGAPLTRHGLQLWCGLPADHEEDEPWFEHTPAGAMPRREAAGSRLRVLIGKAHGLESPVRTVSPTLLVEYHLEPGARLELPAPAAGTEMALYGVGAPYALHSADGEPSAVDPLRLVVLPDSGASLELAATAAPAHVVLVGGAPLGHRYMWWNFVSTRRDRIREAAHEWERGGIGQVPGDTERIELPAKRFE